MKRGAKWLLALIAAGLLCYLALVCAVMARERADYGDASADVGIVLGAWVRPDGQMSTTLQHRVEAALRAFEEGRVGALIACGMRGADEPESEAAVMARYFTARGVPEEAVVVDDRSADTRESLRNAREIMRERGWQTALVVTSDYHLTRALWLCRDEGIDAAGLPAPGASYRHNRVFARLREALSWINYGLGGAPRAAIDFIAG